jgi:outer membrane protein assembly factor BamB
MARSTAASGVLPGPPRRAQLAAGDSSRRPRRSDHDQRDLEHAKFLPNVPSPLLYEGVLYIVKDGGILTSIDPATGKILKQARLAGAPGTYYSSPVGGDGKLYTISLEGKASVIRVGAEWEVLATNDLGSEVLATPAIAEDRIYLRTRDQLYCFGKK